MPEFYTLAFLFIYYIKRNITMELLLNPKKIRYSNCLFIALYVKYKSHGRILFLDKHYQSIVYKALSKEQKDVNILTNHYFAVTPDSSDGEEGYIYDFKSLRPVVKCPLFFRGVVNIRYKDDAFSSYLYTLVWAMQKLEYSNDDIKKEVFKYEDQWKIKTTLGTLLFRGILKEELDTYKSFYPKLFEDIDKIGLKPLVKEDETYK